MMKLGARLATGTQVLLEGAEGMLGGSEGRTVVVTDGEVSGVIDGPKLSVGGTEGSGFGSGSRSGSRDMENESDEDGSESVVVSRFANQPVDIREGVQAAYKSLSRNINSAAQTILAVPMEVYERSGEDVSMVDLPKAAFMKIHSDYISLTFERSLMWFAFDFRALYERLSELFRSLS